MSIISSLQEQNDTRPRYEDKSETMRIMEIDFAKGVLIALMVVGHLTPLKDLYLTANKWVYAFHMSGFLIISGYLFNTRKSHGDFLRRIRNLAVPYVVFSTVYLVASHFLGALLSANHDYTFGIKSFIKAIFISPTGTYWYLHTLIISSVVWYATDKMRLNDWFTLVIGGGGMYLLSLMVDGYSWENILFFLIGATTRRGGKRLTDVIYPTVLSVVPVILITLACDEFLRDKLSGVGLTLFMLSFLMGMARRVPVIIKKIFSTLGENSLSVVLFSPMFTVLTKFYIGFFPFDSSRILWGIASTVFVVGMCLICAWSLDRIGLSRILIQKRMFSISLWKKI